MEKLFDFFLNNIVPKFSATWQPIVIFVVMFLLAVNRYLAKNNMQSAIMVRIQKWLKGMSKDDLMFNDLFLKVEEYKQRINQIHFDNDEKKIKAKVFKTVLKAKLQSDINTVKDFIENKEYDVANQAILAHKFGALTNRLINNADAEIKAYLQKEHGEIIGNKLFNFIMFSPGGWAEKRSERIEHLFVEIDIIRESSAFDNNVERTDHYISSINAMLRSAIFSTERAFRLFNGGIARIIETANATVSI